MKWNFHWHYFAGDTAVTATIIGPTDVKLHNLQIDKAYVDVLYHSKAGLVTVADKLRENIIKNTCESALLSVLYPRSSIILQIYEMENGGGVSWIKANRFTYDDRFFKNHFVFTVDRLRYQCGLLGSIEQRNVDENASSRRTLHHRWVRRNCSGSRSEPLRKCTRQFDICFRKPREEYGHHAHNWTIHHWPIQRRTNAMQAGQRYDISVLSRCNKKIQ